MAPKRSGGTKPRGGTARGAARSRFAGAQALADVVAAARLNRPFRSQDEAVVLSLLLTRKLMDSISQRFFIGKPVTEAEFNSLMILHDYRAQPLKQAEIASMLLVTRLSARDVLLRLERKGLVEPIAHADRRARALRISKAGERVLLAVRNEYYAMIGDRLATMSAAGKTVLLDSLVELRSALRPRHPS